MDLNSIDKLVDDVLRREGGFVNHPQDRGGPTKFGITQQTLSKYLGHVALMREVEAMSEEVARDIYERNFYVNPRIDRLPPEIQAFVFDCAVNHGPRRAIKFVQTVCNAAGYRPLLSLDGAMGPNTKRGADWAQAQMGSLFLKALIEERRNFYLLIVEARPSQQVFLRGWMNRVNEFDRGLA